MKVKDIIMDVNNDLTIDNGDFFVSYSDNQHITDIIYSSPGFWKEFPDVGVNIITYLNSSGQQQQLRNNIQTQLVNDGYKIDKLTIDTFTGDIQISAERN